MAIQTYTLKSCSLVYAPNFVRWAQCGYQFGTDSEKERYVGLIRDGWGLPPTAAREICEGGDHVTFNEDGDSVTLSQEVLDCCLCFGPVEHHANGWTRGHNADPVASGRCCDDCNYSRVIPHRVGLM